MIDISFEKDPDLYKDYKACLEFLRTIDDDAYEYPKDKVKFHVYTEIKTPKELMVIKSFLATQNLEHCEMVVWSDYDIEDSPLVQPYKNLATFKVYDAEEEAIGTPLEGDLKLKMRDSKYYLQSDLARLLLLYKYGGIWVDMDIVFLRDFKPILDQEYMYMWGSETDFANQGACATVLSLQKESDFSLELLKEVLITPPRPETTCWGKDMFATLYKRYPFTVFPSTFFNTEWCVNVKYGPGANHKMNKSWFEDVGTDSDYLFTEAFTWHWHNSSNKDKTVEPNSKFNLLEERMNDLMRKKGIML